MFLFADWEWHIGLYIWENPYDGAADRYDEEYALQQEGYIWDGTDILHYKALNIWIHTNIFQ